MSFTFKHGDRPLDGYTIQRGVGRGGFGEVYYALSDAGKEVALKYLRDNPQIELRGVSQCMNLKSPHLVTIYDVKQNHAGEHFIVMEYISGPSLRDLLIAEGDRGLGPQKAAFFLREIAKGLGYLHDRGIVHRDLKPGNIFYEDGYVKIGDYGLSKFISVSRHSVQTASVGTIHYMAPEVGTGNYHRGIDIYALGVILYEMLLGRVPYDGSSMGEVLMKHLTAQPEVDRLPPPFAEVIRKALAKDPRDRFQTVDEMTAAVFGVGELRDSLARFEPSSLSMAAARAVPVPAYAGVGGSSAVMGAGDPTAPARPGMGSSALDPLRSAPAGAVPPVHEDPWKEARAPLGGISKGLNRTAERLGLMGAARPGQLPRFPPRTRRAAGLLGLFLGAFGAHRFYLGYTRLGIVQLLLTSLTLFGALWGIIEGILILAGEPWKDVYGRPLLEHRAIPIFQPRWLQRLVLAAIIMAGLSAGTTLVHSAGGAGFTERTLEQVLPTVLTFSLASTAAVILGSLLTFRTRVRGAFSPVLGRLTVFGTGLAALVLAGLFCLETFAPSYYLGQHFAARYGTRREFVSMVSSLMGGLATSMALLDWCRRVRRGSEGHIDLGSALAAGIVAGIASCFWESDYALLVGGVAATVSLAVQSASCFRLPEDGGPAGPSGASGPPPPLGPATQERAPDWGGTPLGQTACGRSHPGPAARCGWAGRAAADSHFGRKPGPRRHLFTLLVTAVAAAVAVGLAVMATDTGRREERVIAAVLAGVVVVFLAQVLRLRQHRGRRWRPPAGADPVEHGAGAYPLPPDLSRLRGHDGLPE